MVTMHRGVERRCEMGEAAKSRCQQCPVPRNNGTLSGAAGSVGCFQGGREAPRFDGNKRPSYFGDRTLNVGV
jgi:hypothetical protein